MNADELRLVTELAGLAPSVHNTQPWQFVPRGHTLEVRADPSRMLPVLDPSSRQLHVSCGIAVEFARLAIRSLGYACVVRVLPRGNDPALLATITVGHRQPVTTQERRLVEAIPRRYTDRGPYDDRPLPAETVLAVREAVSDRGCWLRVLDHPGDRLTAVRLLEHAEETEAEDPAYREELAAWRRRAVAPDGVPLAATAPWQPADGVPDVPLRDFTGGGRHPHPDDLAPPRVERDALLLVGSDTDDAAAWVRTGRALGLLLLQLTVDGLVCQPLGPVTDVPATRSRLRRELGLVGYPQILLRAGHGSGQPHAGRRAVSDTTKTAALA